MKYCPYCGGNRLMEFPEEGEYLERKGTFLEKTEEVEDAL